jgi:pyruvate,water dikinase
MTTPKDQALVCWFEKLNAGDVPIVGGKNASLGEMLATLKSKGIRVPDGFATTARVYREFLEFNTLAEPIHEALEELDRGQMTLEQTGRAIRRMMLRAQFPDDLTGALCEAYAMLSRRCRSIRWMWRYAAAPPPKTCPQPVSPDSRRRS